VSRARIRSGSEPALPVGPQPSSPLATTRDPRGQRRRDDSSKWGHPAMRERGPLHAQAPGCPEGPRRSVDPRQGQEPSPDTNFFASGYGRPGTTGEPGQAPPDRDRSRFLQVPLPHPPDSAIESSGLRGLAFRSRTTWV
jgi:hypothetical protein